MSQPPFQTPSVRAILSSLGALGPRSLTIPLLESHAHAFSAHARYVAWPVGATRASLAAKVKKSLTTPQLMRLMKGVTMRGPPDASV